MNKKLALVIGTTVAVVAAACMTGCGSTPDDNGGGENGKNGVLVHTVKVRANDRSDYSVCVDGGEAKLFVGSGDAVTMEMLENAYVDKFLLDTGFSRDTQLYTDEECLTKFTGVIDGETTLYYAEYSPELYGKVIFDYDGEQYSVYRRIGSKLNATDFSRSAYGVGEASDYVFCSDEERTVVLNINDSDVPCGWLQNSVYIYVKDAE